MALAFIAAPTGAQEEVVVAEHDAAGVYWQPAITALYVVTDVSRPIFPDDGPPHFPPPDGTEDEAGGEQESPDPTPEEKRARGLVELTLNLPPADRAPTIETDWLVYDRNRREGYHASALVAARHRGKPRLWLHSAFEREYMASYPANERLGLIVALDVPREKFPIRKDSAGNQLTAEERKKLILDNIRVVAGRLEIREWDGVRKTGSDGREGEIVHLVEEFQDQPLASFAQRGDIVFMARRSTSAGEGDGALLDRVIRASAEFVVQAGGGGADDPLGLAEPLTRKLQAEIRFVVSEKGIQIDKIGSEYQGGVEGGAEPQ